MSSLESENLEAVARMEEALSKAAAAQEQADKAVKMEEDTRAEMAVSAFSVGAVCSFSFLFSSDETVFVLSSKPIHLYPQGKQVQDNLAINS